MKIRSLATIAALSFALVGVTAGAALAEGRDDAAAFPMKADAFQQKVEARIARGKERLEKRISENKVDAAKATEMRAKADARAASVRAAAQAAEADGVVTADEAKAVRAAGGGHRGHGDGDCKGHGDGAKKG